MPDRTAFCILFSTCLLSLLLLGIAVLIPNAGGILYVLLFARLFSVVDSRTAHFEFGLVVDDSDINSVASHLFMICKNWHVPIGLYIIRLVYRPWLGRRVPGWNSPMSPRSCNISYKSTFKAESYRETELLALCQRTAPKQDVSHTFWGLTAQRTPRPQNWVM